jgi:hypothetical protein
MQTGVRGTTPTHPGNITGRQFAQQQKECHAKQGLTPLDLKQARQEGFEQGFDEGWNKAIEWVTREYGTDPEDSDAE